MAYGTPSLEENPYLQSLLPTIEATSFFIGDDSYERCEFTNCQGMYWFLIKAILPSKDTKINLEALSGFFFFFNYVVSLVCFSLNELWMPFYVCMFCFVQRNWSLLKVLCKTVQQCILVMVRAKCTEGCSTWICENMSVFAFNLVLEN